MSTTGSIARLIEQMAANQAQLAVQKGNVYGGMMRSLADIPAGILGMKQDMEDRKLRRGAFERAGELQGLQIDKAKREKKDEADLRSILSAIPNDVPNARQLKWTAFEQFWQTRDPEKAAVILGSKQAEAIKMAALMEGQPGRKVPDPITGLPTELEGREQPHDPMTIHGIFGEDMTVQRHTESELMRKAMALKESGLAFDVSKEKLVSQARAEGRAAGTPDKPDKPPNLSDTEVYADQMAQAHKGATGQDATPAQRAKWMKDYKTSSTQININNRRPRLTKVTTLGKDGKPVTKIVELEEGAEFEAGPTADMRNKAEARSRVARNIGEVEQLSQKVITEKMALAQKAKAAGRSVEAFLANDPEYRTYQDVRMALAGNLAVAQQGSRPSDTDIKAIWLPMVPDVFKDTKDSAAMKWHFIKTLSGAPGSEGAAPGGTGGDDKVIVEKGGKKFRLPRRQLQQAQSEGYTLAQ